MTSSFSTGIAALQSSIDEGKRKAAAATGGGNSLEYFRWEDGDKKILRFLSDDVVTADFYDFIISNDGKTKNFMVPPNDPDRLRRHMSPTPGIGWRKPYKSNNVEEPKLSKKTIGVAVLRNEERDKETGKLRVVDYIYDREVDGEVYPSRYFGVVQQGIKNFWGTMLTYARRFENSLTTVDFEITRQGGGLDTAYSIIPILPPDPKLDTVEAVQQFYFYGQPSKDDDDKKLRFLKCPMTTVQWAEYFSGEERFQHWLGSGGKPAPSGLDEFHSATTMNDEAQAGQHSTTTFDTLEQTLLRGMNK